ncbi:hypothetical protein L1987_27697 [Smallanthus sonchifolius]|uniref:Uncharacterized protein n=1 Tax=Smallanthus sonchifolius TaxID=185202 RepID=A0ACB9IBP1_9ASTR|nr:hypothetical protein L1987_27697 [Smallanthus sonchifolius]
MQFFFIVSTSDILSAWSVSVLQQKVVSGNGCFIEASQLQCLIFSGNGYQLQSWRSAAGHNFTQLADDMPISSNFGLQQIRLTRGRFILQQKNKYPLRISLSAVACWSAANS